MWPELDPFTGLVHYVTTRTTLALGRDNNAVEMSVDITYCNQESSLRWVVVSDALVTCMQCMVEADRERATMLQEEEEEPPWSTSFG